MKISDSMSEASYGLAPEARRYLRALNDGPIWANDLGVTPQHLGGENGWTKHTPKPPRKKKP